MKMVEFLQGKKTYIVVAAMIGLGVAEGFGWIQVPEWAWGIAAGLGLGFLRMGVNSIKQAVQNAQKAQQ